MDVAANSVISLYIFLLSGTRLEAFSEVSLTLCLHSFTYIRIQALMWRTAQFLSPLLSTNHCGGSVTYLITLHRTGPPQQGGGVGGGAD